MSDNIVVKGAREHNLKNIDVTIPRGKLVVVTGLSGSGKSSLAFDTIHAEGQRRYVESLSSYARQFLELQDKPDVDQIDGLSPTIAIEQRTVSATPRSPVGTVAEIYDYLRLLFARAGRAHCPKCHKPVTRESAHEIARRVRQIIDESGVVIMSPVVRDEKGVHKHLLDWALKTGYKEVRFNGIFSAIEEIRGLRRDKEQRSSIDVVLSRYSQHDESPKLDEEIGKAFDLADGFLTVWRQDSEEDIRFSQRLTCSECGIHLPELEPRIFSFNSPHGACPACTGLGTKLIVEPDLVMPNPRLTLAQGAIKPWTRIAGNQAWYMKLLEAVATRHNFSVDTPVDRLDKKAIQVILYGSGDEKYEVEGQQSAFDGVVPNLEKRYKETDSDYVRKEIETYINTVICPECQGKRLRPEVLGVTFGGRTISEVVGYSIDQATEFFRSLLPGEASGKADSAKAAKGKRPAKSGEPALSDREIKISGQALREVVLRLTNLVEVGLGYLQLDRAAVSLSGGELQRVRLATQLCTGLSGVIYVLDEPSIGLHPRDNDKLIGALKRLRDLGNTVIVVEHDDATMEASDYLIDMGPGAGAHRAQIIAARTPPHLQRDKNSLTGKYLSGRERIEIPRKYRKVIGATEFNLKNVSAKFPLGTLTCVTGVSGSGKSTLVIDILSRSLEKKLYRAKAAPGAHKEIVGLNEVDKVISIDQSPIGRTPRSNPATYTGVFTVIRDLFTEQPEAKLKGYDAGKFSFNVKGGGRCEACAGEGMVRIEMQFLPDVYIDCGECRGKRYNADRKSVHYKEKTIADILAMSIEESAKFFDDHPLISEKMSILKDVGFGYLKLGQPATTLSGGEAQRVKLATELSRRATGRTLYILDEPTT